MHASVSHTSICRSPTCQSLKNDPIVQEKAGNLNPHVSTRDGRKFRILSENRKWKIALFRKQKIPKHKKTGNQKTVNFDVII